MPSHIAYNIPPSLSSEEGSQPVTTYAYDLLDLL
jgi:hypothetical protein